MEHVPYDPNLDYLFFGEEISMAARFFTHGGVFFTPPQSVVYHLWSRDHRPNPPSSESEELRDLKKKLKIKSQQMVHDLLKGRRDDSLDPKYGLGTVRSLSEYEQLLNVSFQEMKINVHSTSPLLQLYPEAIFADDLLPTGDGRNQQAQQEKEDQQQEQRATPQLSPQARKNIEVLNLVHSFLA
jgi:hypothetical protein